MKATVTVEFFEYDGDFKNSNGKYYVPDWAVSAMDKGDIYYASRYVNYPPCDLFIKNPRQDDNDTLVEVGDYVIKGPDGTIYACKPDIFKKTYDIVGED